MNVENFEIENFEHMEFLDGEERIEETAYDFSLEAHEREFRAQKKDKPLEVLRVLVNTKFEFEQQVWLAYGSVLRREILYQRAENGCEEHVEWSPVSTPSWEDRNRFFRIHYKRITVPLCDVNEELLENFKGLTLKLSVLVYSDSLISAKDYDRAKEVLALGKRVSGLKDRAGADSNQNLMQLVAKLKLSNKDRFVQPLDASFVLWANHIQSSPAHLRDTLIAGSPPDHLKELFVEDERNIAQALLAESTEDTSIAETVQDNYDIEVAEIEAAFEKVEIGVAELRAKIDKFQACRRNNRSLITAFKRSLRVHEGEESRQYSDNVVDCLDIDHM